MDKLGSGAFSTVVSAVKNSDRTMVAVKIIKKEKLMDEGETEGRTDKCVFQEVDMLRKLQHDNIVKILDFYEGSSVYYIVLGELNIH